MPSRSWRQPAKAGGARRDRTDDLMLAKHALSQLSYGPLGGKPIRSNPRMRSVEPRSLEAKMVGLGRLELPTSRLSSARSNQLSYKPQAQASPCAKPPPSARTTPRRVRPARHLGHSPKRQQARAGPSRKKEKRRRRSPAFPAIPAGCSKRSDRRQTSAASPGYRSCKITPAGLKDHP